MIERSNKADGVILRTCIDLKHRRAAKKEDNESADRRSWKVIWASLGRFNG